MDAAKITFRLFSATLDTDLLLTRLLIGETQRRPCHRCLRAGGGQGLNSKIIIRFSASETIQQEPKRSPALLAAHRLRRHRVCFKPWFNWYLNALPFGEKSGPNFIIITMAPRSLETMHLPIAQLRLQLGQPLEPVQGTWMRYHTQGALEVVVQMLDSL